MQQHIDPTPSPEGLARFTAELGDALEQHARGLATTALRPQRSRRRRAGAWTLSAAVIVAAAVLITAGTRTEPTGTLGVASAAAVMRQSAEAVASESRGGLAPGAYWHTVVEVSMRRSDDVAARFEYATTYRAETWRARNGSGRERVGKSAIGFPTAADRAAWTAAGSPDLRDERASRRLRRAERPFAFGLETLSYAQLERLSADRAALARIVERQADRLPRSFAADERRAYVLFTLVRDAFEAPTTSAVRAALYERLAAVPGLRLGGDAQDHAGRGGSVVAVVLGDARFEMVVDRQTGALLESRRILLRRSEQFPGLSPGLISRGTVLRAEPASRIAG